MFIPVGSTRVVGPIKKHRLRHFAQPGGNGGDRDGADQRVPVAAPADLLLSFDVRNACADRAALTYGGIFDND